LHNDWDGIKIDIMRDKDKEDNFESDITYPRTKLHRYVANKLRQRLTSGQMAGGSKLPSLRIMADEFGVSTMTIRQAIRVLEKEGHLYRISEAGTYVRPTTYEKKKKVPAKRMGHPDL